MDLQNAKWNENAKKEAVDSTSNKMVQPESHDLTELNIY
jgi:hypothetical protein